MKYTMVRLFLIAACSCLHLVRATLHRQVGDCCMEVRVVPAVAMGANGAGYGSSGGVVAGYGSSGGALASYGSSGGYAATSYGSSGA